MVKQKRIITRCPQCQLLGSLIQTTPQHIRRCKNGHRWPDGGTHHVTGYVTLAQRLEIAQQALKEVLSALREAETMILDCASHLTVKQRQAEGVEGCLYKLRQTIKRYERGV